MLLLFSKKRNSIYKHTSFRRAEEAKVISLVCIFNSLQSTLVAAQTQTPLNKLLQEHLRHTGHSQNGPEIFHVRGPALADVDPASLRGKKT